MKHKLTILAVLCLCLSTLTACQCRHEWNAATCTTAKTCAKCEETEGEPLGHTPGPTEEAWDFNTATETVREFCSVCNENIRTDTSPLTTLIRDEAFMFTPREFLDRLTAIAKETYPDCGYEIADSTDSLLAHFLWNPSDVQGFTILFFSPDAAPLRSSDLDSSGVWCVSIAAYGPVSNLGTMISAEHERIIYEAVDPLLDDAVCETLNLNKLAAFLNALYGETTGYAQANGLLYEFQHYAYGEDLGYESIQVYASNWMSD